ncbi:hypothetical protein CS022_05150 [Veronia nyctiphanis]|uniref:Uncharacterized protein n=1 Tax=Veronia nyctiphanis TaxID=1278244 RepID=A0A4Q0YTJ0_9GAMM|nr:DUF3192 domain-containing protein [Veronia nyctiphanis]RXJ74035.1 hypothetical protein CS022_05150 [Veronia nyctiphanis]
MSIKLKHVLTVGLLSLTLQGCVVSLGNDEHGPGWSSSSSHEAQWQRMRNKIADLNVGSSYSDVKKKLGDASFSEAFSKIIKVTKSFFIVLITLKVTDTILKMNAHPSSLRTKSYWAGAMKYSVR